MNATGLDLRRSVALEQMDGATETEVVCDAPSLLTGEGDFSVSAEWGWPSYRQITVESWQGGERETRLDYVAEEVPVALLYNGVPHVVMMSSPQDLEDFAYGFSLTENIVSSALELQSVHIHNRAEGVEVRIRIPEECAASLSGKGRNLTGRTGCGLCGATTLRQAVRHPPPVGLGLRIGAQRLQQALQAMRSHQAINRYTGAVHAAAWVLPDKGIVNVREDVGRHNAVDKLIGALAKTHADFSAGLVLVTSRASYELVQKAAAVGITMLAAISAPTGLAIRLANETGVTLVGFARDDRHVIYSNPQRLLHND